MDDFMNALNLMTIGKSGSEPAPPLTRLQRFLWRVQWLIIRLPDAPRHWIVRFM